MNKAKAKLKLHTAFCNAKTEDEFLCSVEGIINDIYGDGISANILVGRDTTVYGSGQDVVCGIRRYLDLSKSYEVKIRPMCH